MFITYLSILLTILSVWISFTDYYTAFVLSTVVNISLYIIYLVVVLKENS